MMNWMPSSHILNPAPPINLHVSNYEFVSHGVLSLMKWNENMLIVLPYTNTYTYHIHIYTQIHYKNLDELFLYTIFSKRNFF